MTNHLHGEEGGPAGPEKTGSSRSIACFLHLWVLPAALAPGTGRRQTPDSALEMLGALGQGVSDAHSWLGAGPVSTSVTLMQTAQKRRRNSAEDLQNPQQQLFLLN